MQLGKLPTRSGQSLVEALIAIGVLVMGFMGILTLVNQSAGLTRVVANNFIGSYLAAEGIEVIKSLQDSNYLQGRPFYEGFTSCSNANDPCEWEVQWDSKWENYRPGGHPPAYGGNTLNYDPNQDIYSYGGGIPTSFKRKVTVVLSGSPANELTVSSRVLW